MAAPEFVFHWRNWEHDTHIILRRNHAGDYVQWFVVTKGEGNDARRIVRDLNYANEQRAKTLRERKRRQRLAADVAAIAEFERRTRPTR